MDYDKINKGIQKYRQEGKSDQEINAFLKSLGVYAPELNKIDTKKQTSGFMGGIANFLSAPSRNLAEFAQAKLGFNNPQVKQLQETQQMLTTKIPEYERIIQQWKSLGKDTSKLEQAVNEMKVSAGEVGANIQNLQTGGVTGKQAAASAFQTGLSVLPTVTGVAGKALSQTPGLQKAGQALTNFQSRAVTNPISYGATEGAVAGAGFGASEALGEGGGIGDAVGGGILGAGLGAGFGTALVGGIKLASPLIRKLDPQFMAPKMNELWEEINKTFTFAGKTKPQLLKALDPSAIKERGEFAWVDSVYNRTKDLQVTTKKGLKPFDPKKAKPSDFFEASAQGERQAYDEFNSAVSALENPNWLQTRNKIIADLDVIKNDPLSGYDAAAKRKFDSILEEIATKNTPAEVEAYISRILNKNVDSFFSGATEKVENEMSATIKNAFRQSLYKYASDFEGGAQIQSLMKELGGYKEVQDMLTQGLVKSGDNKTAWALNRYGLSQIVTGGLYKNPVQMTKGVAFNALGVVNQLEKSLDAGRLPKLFNMLDGVYKANNLQRGKTPIDLNKLRQDAGMKQLPGAADQPGFPAPRSVITDNSPVIPVNPRGAAIEGTAPLRVGDFSLENLSPAQKTQLQEEILKSIEKITGQKKNLGNEGFINPGVAAAVGGAGALGLLLKNLFGGEETSETPVSQETVSPAKANLRDAFVQVENRGARDRGEDLYKVKGVTGDLGKYQVQPKTLSLWSKPWLGKKYTPEEFLNDPEAQEEFMNQFEAVVDSYKLTPQEAAIIWHKGWGVLGDQKPRQEKEKLLREHIERQKKNENVMKYVEEFNKML